MNATSISWIFVVFFGTTILFGGLRRLTEDSSTAVTVAVQLGALVAVLAVLVLFVRWRSRR